MVPGGSVITTPERPGDPQISCACHFITRPTVMLAIRRILFPTDLSEGAKGAFPHAVSLADWHDADLHILNVREQGDPRADAGSQFPVSLETLDMWLAESSSGDARHLSTQTLTTVQKRIDAPVPAERILAYAKDEDIDVIVMSTHGRQGVQRLLLGSVTEAVVRGAPCPVFTVRTDIEATRQQTIRRILVPVDFSAASDVALAHAKEIAQTYGAEIDLLHVVEETAYPSTYGIDPTHFPSQDVLDRAEDRLSEMAREDIGYEHVTISATIGYAPTIILDYAEENDVDLVVIATHGRTGLDRVIMGSVAERVIRKAPIPVFAVKPDRKSLVPSVTQKAAAAPE